MHTAIEKHAPRGGAENSCVNEDGKVWEPRWTVNRSELVNKKYHASIPDKRLFHFSFDSFGYHGAYADTIKELIEDIRSFDVPYYSSSSFLDELCRKDVENTQDDRQVLLYCDGCGTKITRGQMTLMNMTDYTSF